jgi:hypothetical protein
MKYSNSIELHYLPLKSCCNLKQLLLTIFIMFSWCTYAKTMPEKTQAKKLYSDSALRTRNTYADALIMSNLYTKIIKNRKDKSKSIDSIRKLLSYYNWSVSDRGNFLFTSLLKLNVLIDTNRGIGVQSPTTTQGYSSSGANEQYSGNPESIALNAIATFMATRAKEEILYYAIDKIFDIVNDKGNVGQKFRQLFPKTTTLILKLKKGGVYYPSDFSLVKQTMEMDLRDLPLTLPMAIKFTDPLVNDIEVVAGQSYVMIRDGKKIQDLITDWGSYNWNNKNIKISTHYLQLISNALKDTIGSSHYWINTSEVSALNPLNIGNNSFQQFYYGLLYQQLKFQPEAFIQKICKKISDTNDLSKFCAQINGISNIAQELNTLKDSLLKRPRQVDINWIINRSNQTINLVSNFSSLSIFNDSLSIPNSYFTYADQVLDMARLIQQKEYSSALSSLIVDLSQDSLVSQIDLRKITFFIQLSQIKDESEFTAFLESYAAPIGSSALKRNAIFNLSLNGYVGLNGGYEWVTNSVTKNKNNTWYGGVAAPIGISFSFPLGMNSFTAFISVLDLGSLVNARFNNDSASYSNLRLDQFFSPGIGVFYNIKGTPITFGGYLCRINNVRNIQYSTSTATITETNRNVVRLNFTVLIDIPFLTFSNKPN